MHNRLKLLRNTEGITLVETIITMAVLGAVIVPLMNLFVMSEKINNESSIEYKSILQAQKYIEEIKALPLIDTSKYIYDSSLNSLGLSYKLTMSLVLKLKLNPKAIFYFL